MKTALIFVGLVLVFLGLLVWAGAWPRAVQASVAGLAALTVLKARRRAA